MWLRIIFAIVRSNDLFVMVINICKDDFKTMNDAFTCIISLIILLHNYKCFLCHSLEIVSKIILLFFVAFITSIDIINVNRVASPTKQRATRAWIPNFLLKLEIEIVASCDIFGCVINSML